MNNLIIIGNGFDLAHGLKSSYDEFIDDAVKKTTLENSDNFLKFHSTRQDNEGRNNIFNYNEKYISTENVILNKMFSKRISDNLIKKNNWSDIESTYFELVETTLERKHSNYGFNINDINSSLLGIQNRLVQYLLAELDDFKSKAICADFFNNFNYKETLLLNFNYTDLVSKIYPQQSSRLETINIHGELRNDDNPIIFGYSVSEDKLNTLRNQPGDDYLWHIKNSNYSNTTNIEKIEEFLNESDGYFVHILGHSCAATDHFLLNLISTDEKMKGAFLYYYNERDNFKKQKLNLEKIVRDPVKTRLIKSFPHSARMPQLADNDNLINHFKKKLQNIVQITNPFK